ncbi:hypothetical protein ZWY2020_036672 [Hordeum vulgare]|nr:hypothetical protein ZWY2020_036672 [Hordeum vulgare]
MTPLPIREEVERELPTNQGQARRLFPLGAPPPLAPAQPPSFNLLSGSAARGPKFQSAAAGSYTAEQDAPPFLGRLPLVGTRFRAAASSTGAPPSPPASSTRGDRRRHRPRFRGRRLQGSARLKTSISRPLKEKVFVLGES